MKYQTRQALRLLLLALIVVVGTVVIVLVLGGCTVIWVHGDMTGDICDNGGHGNWTPAGRTPLKDLLHPGGEKH